jgi:hypothetical protein
MNIEDLTIKQARELANLFDGNAGSNNNNNNNNMIGKYVIVRCREAGVHSGILESCSGRECTLTDSRRLWYWKTKKGDFLSSVAINGVSHDSKIGAPVIRIYLSESCEVIECSTEAEASIRDQVSHNA